MARKGGKTTRGPKKGPSGPKRGLAGKSGTNKATPMGGASTSGFGHVSAMVPGHSNMQNCTPS